MVPKLPDYMQHEPDGNEFNKTKVSAAFLEAKKQKHIFNIIN